MNAAYKASVNAAYLTDLADEELFIEYRIFGDFRYFEELVRRYRPQLARFLKARYGLSFDRIEEALQSTFLRVWQKRDLFDASKSVRPWIFRIAATQTVNMLREQRRREYASLDEPRFEGDSGAWANDILSREQDPSYEMERQDASLEVRRALAQLPAKFRQVLELVFLQGLTRQSAADALNLTVATVSRRVKRALECMSARLFNGNEDSYDRLLRRLAASECA